MPRAMEHRHPQAFFVRGPSAFARLLFFAALSIALMATDSRLHYLIEIRQGFVALLQPLQMIANLPTVLYGNVREQIVSHQALLEDNRKLSLESLQQNAQLQRLRALQEENNHLRSLLGAGQSISQPAKLGEITHAGRDPFTHKVIVNLGSQQGIIAGQAVVDGAGVIGQVTRVYPFSSEVTLITDKELAIPVQAVRNSLRAIAFGQGGDNTIELPYLPANVDIREGDVLVTSGIDGIYPMGLAVAKVTRIERTLDSPFAHIVCKPTAGIENHRQVLLIGASSAAAPSGAVIGSDSKSIEAAHHAAHKP